MRYLEGDYVEVIDINFHLIVRIQDKDAFDNKNNHVI